MSHFTLHEQVLGHQVSDGHLPDVNLIGEMGDVTELGKLLQLALGCAVSCEKKQGKLCCNVHRNRMKTFENDVGTLKTENYSED